MSKNTKKKISNKTMNTLNLIRNNSETAWWVATPLGIVGVLSLPISIAIDAIYMCAEVVNATATIIRDKQDEKDNEEK